MHIFHQYRGLRRENYILFLGRIVTSLGSMVWPVLTLILNQKLGLSATQVALVTVGSGVLFLPIGLLGGRLADRHNKKNIIVICDLISIVFYIICAAIPLSFLTIALFLIAAAFQNIEYPAYNALIADITPTEQRETAYSLQYLGANIGLIASPTIAGFLFANYLWLAFAFSGVAIATSTVLIFFQLKDITPVVESGESLSYQQSRKQDSLFTVLRQNKVILLFVTMMSLYGAAYQQYSYLMPLDMGRLHGETGAVLFGSVTSLNCIIVVIFTPILTSMLAKTPLTKRFLLGQGMLLLGYVVFLIMLGKIPAYYLTITLFTFGEIICTISCDPYTTARIPQSHRGRVNGLMTVAQGVIQGVVLLAVGNVYDGFGATAAWGIVLGILLLAMANGVILVYRDRAKYPKLYENANG